MSGTQILISTTLSNEENTISVRDAFSQNILSSYKTADGTVVPAKCLQLIGDMYLVCTYSNTAILNVWSLAQKDAIHRKIILPKSNPTCMAVSSDSSYIILGIESKIYIWDLRTGRLLNILEQHYGIVTHLILTDDCSRLVSAGQDTLIHIWNFSKVLVPIETLSVVNGVSSRYCSMKSISLRNGQINDLYLTPNANAISGLINIAFSKGYIAIYTMMGQHVASLSLSGEECIPRCVIMDRAQTHLYIGMENGDILETKASSWNKNGELKTAPQLITINLKSDKSSQKSPEKSVPKYEQSSIGNEASQNTLQGHSAAVTCLQIRWDGYVLVSGSFDKRIMFWDVESRQCIQTLNQQGPISNLILSGYLSGLSVYDSLDSQLNLELATSNVSHDISFSSNSGEKRSKNISRTITNDSHGQLMKLPTNPPPTVATKFERKIEMNKPYNFESKQYSTANHGSVGVFNFGSIIIENSFKHFNIDLDDSLFLSFPTDNVLAHKKNEKLKELRNKKNILENEEDASILAVKELVQVDPIIDHEFVENIFKDFNY